MGQMNYGTDAGFQVSDAAHVPNALPTERNPNSSQPGGRSGPGVINNGH